MNPNFLEIGPITVKWYAVIILIGIIIGSILAIREAKKYNISFDNMLDLILGILICAIIGARIYYVIFEWNYYSNHLVEILKIWHGGLAIHGGIIGGLVWLLIKTKGKKEYLLRLTDIIVISLILGQAIGRWGNFFNSEAHGPKTSIDFLESIHLPNFVIEGMNIGFSYYHPTFLYESLWCLLGFITLLLIRKFIKVKLGQLTGCYLIWYGIGRFLIESLRTDSLFLGNLKIAQLISIIMIIGGLILIIVCNKNIYYKEEKKSEK